MGGVRNETILEAINSFSEKIEKREDEIQKRLRDLEDWKIKESTTNEEICKAIEKLNKKADNWNLGNSILAGINSIGLAIVAFMTKSQG